MRQEEKLARDIYEFLCAKLNAKLFGNIRRSEQTHMDRMKIFITSFRLNDTTPLSFCSL
ncbi:MAG: DUF2202 domain-containing protein [Chitinophagaceae bacterium]|nr:DUF2202 domain-containing protein [Chitinophagaceae bacterium]